MLVVVIAKTPFATEPTKTFRGALAFDDAVQAAPSNSAAAYCGELLKEYQDTQRVQEKRFLFFRASMDQSCCGMAPGETNVFSCSAPLLLCAHFRDGTSHGPH